MNCGVIQGARLSGFLCLKVQRSAYHAALCGVCRVVHLCLYPRVFEGAYEGYVGKSNHETQPSPYDQGNLADLNPHGPK